MKKIILVLSFIACLDCKAQFVARMEIKEPIPGVCDNKEVYALFPSLKGQVEAVAPITKEELLKRLNAEVPFVKENPKHKDKGMMNLIINCKGEMVRCEIDNKTKSPELDKQLENVFKTLLSWKPGSLNGKEVDSSLLYSFKIKKGQITFD